MSSAEARAIDVTISETGMPEYERDATIAEQTGSIIEDRRANFHLR